MGCCSSTTQQTTSIPPPTPEEQEMMQMTIDSLMPAYLDQAGFEVTKTTTTWDQTEEGKRMLAQQAELQKKLGEAQSVQGQNNQQGTGRNGPGAQGGQTNNLQAQLDALNAKIQKAQDSYKPETSFTTRKKDSPEVEAIRDKYGADSQEYKDAKDKYLQDQITAGQNKQDVENLVLENTKKFLSGDFSLNAGQKQFLDDALGPIKDATMNAVKYIQDEAAKTEKNVGSAINDFATQVKQTGMDMGDAIQVLEDRVKQTGANMKTALNDEISMTKNLITMGLQDFTLDQRKRINAQAVALGRSPSDPEFQMEMQQNVNREIERTGLELGQYAAEKDMAIQERTGAGMENAANLRLGVAERTGAGLENAAQQRIGLAQSTGAIRQGAAQMQGQGEIGIAESAANLRQNMVMGLPTSQIGTGINVAQYQQALNQQQLANLGSAVNMPLNIYQTLAQNRYAQPTTTGTSTPSAASVFTGLVGAGLSGVGAAYGAGWLGNKGA